MTHEELYEQTRLKAEAATNKFNVERAAEVVTMLDTPGGKHLVSYLDELYETEAKIDPSKYTKYLDGGGIEVSKETLGMHYGIATMIHTLRNFFDEQRALVHASAVKNAENSVPSTDGV